MTDRELAEQTAADIFTNGDGQQAFCLQLRDCAGFGLGGWSRESLTCRLESALAQHVAALQAALDHCQSDAGSDSCADLSKRCLAAERERDELRAKVAAESRRLDAILGGPVKVEYMGTTVEYLNFAHDDGRLTTTADGTDSRAALDEALNPQPR